MKKTQATGSTRNEILEKALDLFSVNGYEATSMLQIADAVGIRKASLYSHFTSKQDILDNIINSVLTGYANHSMFANANWDDPEYVKDKSRMDGEKASRIIQEQIQYILHDPHIAKGRKMLVIEQFRNSKIAHLQSKQNYENIMNYFIGMIHFLIRDNVLKEYDSLIMAAQLSSPITVWINLCDREPEREQEVMDLIHRHVLQFFEVYHKQSGL